MKLETVIDGTALRIGRLKLPWPRPQRILVVGAGAAGKSLVRAIEQNGGRFDILGFVDDDPAKQGEQIGHARVIGAGAQLTGLLRQLQPDKLVIAITQGDSMQPQLLQSILSSVELGIPLTMMDAVYERITGCVPVEHCGRDLHMFLPGDAPMYLRLYAAVRRLLDLLLGLFGALFVGMIVPWIWVANRIASPGPLFYAQDRVGRYGKVFRILKFRSMVVNAEQAGAVWAQERDPRITPLGRFLRKTRLDECPQFINVLRGEMSLIGPRPERPVFVEELSGQMPLYRLRHVVRPGITGWAQVKNPYASSLADSLLKLQHDLYYIKRQGPYLDGLIILKTVQVVLGLKGR